MPHDRAVALAELRAEPAELIEEIPPPRYVDSECPYCRLCRLARGAPGG